MWQGFNVANGLAAMYPLYVKPEFEDGPYGRAPCHVPTGRPATCHTPTGRPATCHTPTGHPTTCVTPPLAAPPPVMSPLATLPPVTSPLAAPPPVTSPLAAPPTQAPSTTLPRRRCTPWSCQARTWQQCYPPAVASPPCPGYTRCPSPSFRAW